MRQVRSKLQSMADVSDYDFGTNPCSEIILRPYQFCNLTEVVVRATDSVDDLVRKVRLATILGTIQSTYTSSPTCERCGNEIQKKNDCWVCHSQG